jgi:hypothetical protein
LYDVIIDDGLSDGSEVLVPITEEETVVAAAEVNTIR